MSLSPLTSLDKNVSRLKDITGVMATENEIYSIMVNDMDSQYHTDDPSYPFDISNLNKLY